MIKHLEQALEFITKTDEFQNWDSRTTPEWFVQLAALASPPAASDEYTALVRLTRSLSADSDVVPSADPNKLAEQIAFELQDGYDLAAIAGHFQIESVTINGVTTTIDHGEGNDVIKNSSTGTMVS